jgi:hypothetical protein
LSRNLYPDRLGWGLIRQWFGDNFDGSNLYGGRTQKKIDEEGNPEEIIEIELGNSKGRVPSVVGCPLVFLS